MSLKGKIKRVVMVEPKSPPYHVFSFARLPRLGLPLLGALLQQRGCQVTIFCEDLAPLDWDELAQADLALVSTITCTAPRAYEIAEFCKERGTPTVMGGPHVTFLPEEALQHCHFAVRGEGEETMLELLDALNNGGQPYGIKGVSFWDGDRIVHNQPRPLTKDLDALPFPDLSLIYGHHRITATPIMTSRGCPYDCTFCSVTAMFGHRFRHRSVESVIEELRFRKPCSVFFYDDIFNADTNRMASLLEEIMREGFSFRWSAQCHTHLIIRQRHLLPLMRRSGCYALYLGFESVNPDTLQEYNKRQTVEEIREAVELLHRHGILVHGMFVLGADNDDKKTVRETVRFALRHRIDTAQFLILTPIPGTRLYQNLREKGRLIIQRWDFYDGHHVVFRPQKLSPAGLQVMTMKAMQRFYSLMVTLWNLVATPSILRTTVAAFFLFLTGNFKKAIWRLRQTREVLAAMMRLYGWLRLRQFARAQRQFVSELLRLNKPIGLKGE